MSALTNDEAKANYIKDRITEKDGKFYLDGRELTANEVTRYKNALANLDQSTTDTSSENAIKNSDNSMSYEPNGEMSIKYSFNRIQQAYDSEGNSFNASNYMAKALFENSFHAMDELLKSSSITNGTIIKMDGLRKKSGSLPDKEVSVYAVYNNGKLYYIKDSLEKWKNTSDDNKITIDKNGNVIRGDKTKG